MSNNNDLLGWSSNYGDENGSIMEIGKAPNFSRNLDQEEIDLESGIVLSKGIKLSSESLQKFKKDVWKELFNVLDERFQPMWKLKRLKKATEVQIAMNNDRIKGVLTKFWNRKIKIGLVGADLDKTLQEINEQEAEELSGINRIMEVPQKDLKRQEELLVLLTSNDTWKALLSMSDDKAPWIKLNVWWNSYEIRKWQQCMVRDVEWKIGDAIGKRIKQYDEGLSENTDLFFEILAIFTRPFYVEGKLDEQTIKYYYNSIINCVNNTDIVETIAELHVERKEVEEKINGLRTSIEELDENVKQLQSYLKEEKDKKTGEITEETEYIQLKPDMSNLSDFMLIEYLRYLSDTPENIWKDLGISNKNVENYKEIIDWWLWIAKSGEGLTKKYIWKNGKINSLKTNIIKVDKKQDLLDCFEEILRFIWEEFSKDRKREVERLWCVMKYNFIWYCLKEEDIDLLVNGNFLEEIENILKDEDCQGEHRKRFKSFIEEKKEELKKFKELVKNLKEKNRMKEKDEDLRKNFINEYFKKIFGIWLDHSALGDVWKRKEDSGIVVLMISKLIEKINLDRKKQVNFQYAVLNRVNNSLLLREDVSLNEIDKNIRKMINEVVLSDDLLGIWKIDIDEYKALIKKYEWLLKNFSQQLEKCKNVEDYDNIIRNMGGEMDGSILGEIKKKVEDVKNLNNIMKWCWNWENESLDNIPEEIPGEICLMVWARKILEKKEFTLGDKLQYVDALKYDGQNRIFRVVCDNESDGNILKNIFGDKGVEVEHDKDVDDKIKEMKEALRLKCEIKDEKKFEKQVRCFLRGRWKCDTTLKNLDKKEGKKNCRSLRVGNTSWRILLLKEDGVLYFDSLLPHDDYDDRISKSKNFS